MVLPFLCLFWCAIFCYVQYISPAALFHIGSRERNTSLSSTKHSSQLEKARLLILERQRQEKTQKSDLGQILWSLRNCAKTLYLSVLQHSSLLVNPQPKPYKNQVRFLNVSACQMQSVDVMRKKNQVQKHERANPPLKSSTRERGSHHLSGKILAREVWDLKSIIFLGQLS